MRVAFVATKKRPRRVSFTMFDFGIYIKSIASEFLQNIRIYKAIHIHILYGSSTDKSCIFKYREQSPRKSKPAKHFTFSLQFVFSYLFLHNVLFFFRKRTKTFSLGFTFWFGCVACGLLHVCVLSSRCVWLHSDGVNNEMETNIEHLIQSQYIIRTSQTLLVIFQLQLSL